MSKTMALDTTLQQVKKEADTTGIKPTENLNTEN